MSPQRPRVTTTAIPEPTAADLDGIVDELKKSWTAKVTVRRQSRSDFGHREVYVSLDSEKLGPLFYGQEISREVRPGPHRLRVHNTLFWKTLDFTVTVGEHASFVTINREGFGTYSIMAFFLGAGPLYLTLGREAYYGVWP